MNNKNTDYLINKYPDLFRPPSFDLKSGLMGFGFEHGDGWFKIIKECCEKLQKEFDKNADRYNSDTRPYVCQVKEKYGWLRFYLSSGTDAMFKITDEAEDKSKTICEKCGKKSKIRKLNGWLFNRCNSCFAELKKEKKQEEKEYAKWKKEQKKGDVK